MAAVLAVVVSGGLTAALLPVLPQEAPPAGGGDAAIPSNLVAPSAWTPGTDRLGPPGPLAVVMGAQRRTGLLGTARIAVVGVGAKDGTYRFLDLPGQLSLQHGLLADDARIALSPDGRFVAYWLGDSVGSGIAVYDTVTGRVRRQPIESRMGVAPDSLVWVDTGTLLYRFGVITQLSPSSMSTNLAPAVLWDLRADELTGLDERSEDAAAASPMPGGGFSTFDGTSTLRTWARQGGSWTDRSVTLTGLGKPVIGSHEVAPGGGRVAVTVVEDERRPASVWVGEVPPGAAPAKVALRRVELGGSARPQRILGWQDDDHVVVEEVVAARSSVSAVDVRDGSSRRLVRNPAAVDVPGRFYAAGLWSRPTVQRPLPPSGTSPRSAAFVGAGLGGLVVVLGVLVVRRRRRGVA